MPNEVIGFSRAIKFPYYIEFLNDHPKDDIIWVRLEDGTTEAYIKTKGEEYE